MNDKLKKLLNKKLLTPCCAILLALLPLIISTYRLSLLTQILIFGMLAMSLNILVGYTGLISFNHATFFGISGYAAGLLVKNASLNFWLVLLSGILASMLLAAVIGLIILRSSGSYFFILTLAFGQLVFAAAWKWRALTGGDDGLPGISRPELGFGISAHDNISFYYLVLVIFLLIFILLRKLLSSSLGRNMKGVRESESRMQALGYNTWLIKYGAYILAAGFAGAAGVLNALFNGFVSPQELNWTMSGMIMLMVIIGGTGILAGPAIGAAIIVLLQNWSSSYTDHWPFIVGVIFIVCVMFARNGVAGKLQELSLKGMKLLERFGNRQNQ